jgi:hypothetical protein
MSKEKANLARIRDNQRRSRARRKEYLQELENRLRQCELQGIEASSEIQLAARRVADENKKLRGLLAQHGVADESIDVYLQSSPTCDTVLGNHLGSSSGAVQTLEQLLQTRKACCSDGNTGAPSNSRNSSTSVSTVHSTWDTANPHRRSTGPQSIGKAASTAQQYMTPSGSSTSSIGHRSSHSMSNYQRLNPIGLSRGHSPGSADRGQLFDFDTIQPSYHPHQSAQQHLHSSQGAPVYMPSTSSCVFATDMITTMAGADPNAVRTDLGCLPGMECEVNTHEIFNVMDRYTGSGVGL